MSEIWIPRTLDEDLSQYDDAQYERHPHGIIFVNGKEVASTLQCPHCAQHFVSRKGSGHRRTFCFKCKAVTCGDPQCDACRPFADQTGWSQNGVL